MNETQLSELNQIKENVINSMNTILEHSEDEFSANHVQRCEMILDSFISSAKDIGIKDLFNNIAKDTILQLNKLNNSVDKSLIDVMERSEIVKLINQASQFHGYTQENQDITKEFREW